MSDALEDFYAELRRHHLEALWRINTRIMPFEPKPRAKAWLWRYEDLARLAEQAGKLVPIDRGGGPRVLAAINPGPATGTAPPRCGSWSRGRGRGRLSTASGSTWLPATWCSRRPTPGTTTRTTP